MDIVVSHQKAHTVDGGGKEADFNQQGNREVDELVQMGRIVLYRTEADKLKALHIDWGHPGPKIFIKRLRQDQIEFDPVEAKLVCQQCITCQEQKPSNLGRVSDQHIKTCTPWSQIALETMGPMKSATVLGHRYAIVAVCMATGYTMVHTAKTCNALPVLTMLNLLTLTLGRFQSIRTDEGRQYKNKKVEEWCTQRGVKHTFSPPYTPQANGCAERTIGKLKTTLGLWRADKDWGPKLVQACIELSSTPTSSGPSPRELMGLPGQNSTVDIPNPQSTPLPCVLKVGDWIRIRKNPAADNSDLVIPKKYGKKRIIEEIISANTVRTACGRTVDIAQLRKVFPLQ